MVTPAEVMYAGTGVLVAVALGLWLTRPGGVYKSLRPEMRQEGTARVFLVCFAAGIAWPLVLLALIAGEIWVVVGTIVSLARERS